MNGFLIVDKDLSKDSIELNAIKVTSLLFIPIILCVKRFFYSMSMYDVLMKCVLSILICSVLYLTMLFLTKNPSLNFLLKGKKNESNF